MSGSGCRDRAELLPPAIYRAAVCASLFALENQQSIGIALDNIAIMITASHNPACDNGIKIGYST
jgi:phosphomannomutase